MLVPFRQVERLFTGAACGFWECSVDLIGKYTVTEDELWDDGEVAARGIIGYIPGSVEGRLVVEEGVLEEGEPVGLI